MFDNLSQKLGDIFDKLKKRGALSEADVEAALREIRVALLEADVALPVVKDFVNQVKERAVGQEVIKSITPGQMVVKIVHDQLVSVLGSENVALNLATNPPAVMMVVGLQGSGKTTSTAKIARFLKVKKNKKILMASVDIYRPAAREQLEILGRQVEVDTLEIIEKEKPLEIVKRAYNKAKLEGYDILLLDTAGRLHVDEELMEELTALKKAVNPIETLLVADAMTGQDAVNIARNFQEKVGLTGIVLTRIDGDGRGGAALSIKAITGCPIKLLGIGEHLDQIEEFHPERIAGRILDMGDVLSLVEKAVETIDREEAEKLAHKASKGEFDLDDLASQLRQVSKMGGMGGVLSMLPGMGKMKERIQDAGLSDQLVKRQLAIISSMTIKERRNYKLLNGSRRKRIAGGSGTAVADVNRLLKQFQDMRDMMKRMSKVGEKGLKRQGLRGLLGK
ncbi:MAG: signal recognition particle protein [Candidatus Paracaedimonas acanthamoebae]|uniref:Signal recognition particle protein n=1 Tax=Candidatus Paracaedimonas acanthamoebae TaxID=244581 RepID=A0A8J7TU09_9PROT|nr:signal recognition particle protein [Candidatus Paracaedimonas acanthamoebae]